MASEIRANKQTNRVGLGTVTYTDTGIIVSGIVTANSFKGDGSSLTGIDATALKDTAGAVKIQAQASGAVHSGISSFNEIHITTTGTTLRFKDNSGNQLGAIAGNSSNFGFFGHGNGNGRLDFYTGGNYRMRIQPGGDMNVGTAITFSGTTGNATYSGIVTATSFSGDGSSLSNLPAGAPVGGASTNTVFFENDKAVAVNYQITSTKNAMSAGPISINAGIAVTVPSGCSWTIV